jgi:hypothetical protein
MLSTNWIGKVLGAVAVDCHGRGEPLLSALCVRKDGTIGDGYADAVADTHGGDPPADFELHAAEERRRCNGTSTLPTSRPRRCGSADPASRRQAEPDAAQVGLPRLHPPEGVPNPQSRAPHIGQVPDLRLIGA